LYEGREFQTGKPDITIILKRVDERKQFAWI